MRSSGVGRRGEDRGGACVGAGLGEGVMVMPAEEEEVEDEGIGLPGRRDVLICGRDCVLVWLSCSLRLECRALRWVFVGKLRCSIGRRAGSLDLVNATMTLCTVVCC